MRNDLRVPPVRDGSRVPPLRKALRRKAPGLALERELWAGGHDIVVGIDEVGKGAWAGPLTLVAAVVPADRRVYKVRDSKLLTEMEREAMHDRLSEWCRAWAVGHASPEECDDLGMSEAQRLAARRALETLGLEPSRVLVDGNWDFVGRGITRTIVKGDRTSLSIATASVLAKVTRDRIMRSSAPRYPGYAFESNKGYPCPTHRAHLQVAGPTDFHRHTWACMDELPFVGLERRRRPDPQGTLFA